MRGTDLQVTANVKMGRAQHATPLRGVGSRRLPEFCVVQTFEEKERFPALLGMTIYGGT